MIELRFDSVISSFLKGTPINYWSILLLFFVSCFYPLLLVSVSCAVTVIGHQAVHSSQ